MKTKMYAALAAAVAGLVVTSANAAPLLTIDDFTEATDTALITLPGNVTSISKTDSGIDPLHTIGGSRTVTLERATGTIYKGAIHPQGGIGQNEDDVYVFSVAAPSDFQPKATLTYGLNTVAGLNLKDSEFNFDLVSFDAPGGGALSLTLTITGTNAAVESITIPALSLGTNHIPQVGFTDDVLTSVDTISFAFTGTAGADFSISSLAVGIPEPTSVLSLVPALGLMTRRRR